MSALLIGCLAILVGGTGFLLSLSTDPPEVIAAERGVPPGLHGLVDKIETLTGGTASVSFNSATGKARFVRTELSKPIPQPGGLPARATPEQAARGFLSEYGSLFGLTDQASQLSALGTNRTADGRTFVRFQQMHNGVPVIGGELIVQVASQGKGVVSAGGEAAAAAALVTIPEVSSGLALEKAVTLVAKYYAADESGLRCSRPSLWVYNPSLLGVAGDRSSLVWRMEVDSVNGQPISELVLVDAQQGFVVMHFSQIEMAKTRRVYDAGCTSTLPGTLARSEGQPATGDADVDYAYTYAGYAYDFYHANHGRDSIDGAGMAVACTVHYDEDGGCDYQNLFWDGSQIVLGTGMASGCDLVAHEFTHGVTQHESYLFYYMQSGAISESFSDIWGEFTELTYNAGPAADRWLIGEDLSGGAARDMEEPTAYGQPDRMTSPFYACGSFWDDGGGVHTNSGVANKAAFLMVDGGSFNGYTVAGMGIPKTADLFYEVQANLLTSGSDYADLYNALQQAAVNLGYSAADRQTVQDAIDAVEMDQLPGSCPATEAPLCDYGSPVMLFSDDLEDPDSGNWVTGSLSGGNYWDLVDFYAASGQNSYWGYDCGDVADYYVAMTFDVALPADRDACLYFRHSYEFDADWTEYYDGGVVEFSTDGGGSWQPMGCYFAYNGYSGEISMYYDNPLWGNQAFVGRSDGFISSRLDIGPLAGENIRFRFRIGSDSSVDCLGWFIDDIMIYSIGPDTTPPGTPTLLSPTGPWLNDAACSVFDWTDVTDPSDVTYECEISSRPDFSYVEYFRMYLSESTCTRTGYLADGTYYWMVRARDQAGNEGAWSDVWTFGLDNTAPGVPIQVGPADGARTSDTTPAIDWSDVSDTSGVTFELQLDNEPEFSSPVLSRSALSNSTYTLAGGEALADGVYYWRVTTMDGAGNMSGWTAARSFTIDTELPPVPALVTPANGKAITDSTPYLDWSDAMDPSGVHYELQVDNDSVFTSPEFGRTWVNASSCVVTTVLADGTYYWRVRAVDGAGNASGWTAARSFSVDATTPAVPVLASPSDGKAITDSTPWLDWLDVTDASGVHYQIQVDDNPDFSSLAFGRTWVNASSCVVTNVLADGMYCWKVRAVDGAGNASGWTAARSFSVDATTPAVPVLASPSDGKAITDSTPWLDWLDVTDASGVHYQIQVDDNPDFSSLAFGRTWVNASSCVVTNVLADGMYCWKVRAVDGAGNASAWTAPRSVVVDTTAPSLPVLSSPGNGKTITDTTPWVDWTDAADATAVHYQIQVDNDAGFTSLAFTRTWVNASSCVVTTTLPPGTYYWRVRAVDVAANTSPWTAAWTFTLQ